MGEELRSSLNQLALESGISCLIMAEPIALARACASPRATSVRMRSAVRHAIAWIVNDHH
ncbi:hypothetical protein [Burkholderia vietnamiensis]|uniref:hypothetical protein n=1 Tax=Burkholderia vietnamiensis TaxID=60552 RepID=UPI0012D9BE2C|nr:hypothetical protein [Burkholderia vietnamiensis]